MEGVKGKVSVTHLRVCDRPNKTHLRLRSTLGTVGPADTTAENKGKGKTLRGALSFACVLSMVRFSTSDPKDIPYCECSDPKQSTWAPHGVPPTLEIAAPYVLLLFVLFPSCFDPSNILLCDFGSSFWDLNDAPLMPLL